MIFIYCLYASDDGNPKYVGHSTNTPDYRLKQHVTAALEKQTGALYDWMHTVWRRGAEVLVFVLQEGVAADQGDAFEAYWKTQFSGLLSASPATNRDSSVGAQIRTALQKSISTSD
jgi:hypothetical protein